MGDSERKLQTCRERLLHNSLFSGSNLLAASKYASAQEKDKIRTLVMALIFACVAAATAAVLCAPGPGRPGARLPSNRQGDRDPWGEQFP